MNPSADTPVSMVPRDDFTPYGYLHVPGHTRNLSVKGVVRSHEAGFRFHVPAYAGMYGGRRETYRAGMSLAVDGTVVLTEFDRVSSPVHTKNRIGFDIAHGSSSVGSEWFLAGDDVIVATLGDADATGVAVLLEYQRTVSANGEWGESGLVGRRDGDDIVLQSFEDGEAFLFSASADIQSVGITPELDEALGWIRQPSSMTDVPQDGWVNALGSRGDNVQLYAVVILDSQALSGSDLRLARGSTLSEARTRLRAAIADDQIQRARHQIEDETFWKDAPRLSGDWPDSWRRGLVYDLETLRMMVMQPIGIYDHIWDGMQIQAPRVVLGEAAIDALLLSYADPELAQELLFGVFEDAPEPNVPCSREDGTYNMVSARGEVCGTGPQWGYPWLVLDWLWRQRPDLDWLERVYPLLDAYLDWWLRHRTAPDGGMWFECSWESGQDGTPRLGDQPLGGGHPTPHVRPVDLHASMAHAAQVMSRFADALGLGTDINKWDALATSLTRHTRVLWNGSRFADFDSTRNQFTDIDDVMLFSPVQLGIASQQQVEQVRSAIGSVDPDILLWPMFAWTVVDAAAASGERDHAVSVAASICDRAWGFWDARVHEAEKTMPGITCEYWPLSGRCGGEGYGWGAFQLHLFFHTMLGYEPTPDGLVLAPNLPPDMREIGKRYGIELTREEHRYDIWIEPLEADRVRLSIDGATQDIYWGESITIAE